MIKDALKSQFIEHVNNRCDHKHYWVYSEKEDTQK